MTQLNSLLRWCGLSYLLFSVGCGPNPDLTITQETGDAPVPIEGPDQELASGGGFFGDLSPDGKYLLVNKSCCMELYDANTLQGLWLLKTNNTIVEVSFAPQGDKFIARDSLNYVAVYAFPSGNMLYRIGRPDRGTIFGLSFGADGKSLIGNLSPAGYPQTEPTKGMVWDLSSGKHLYTVDMSLNHTVTMYDRVLIRPSQDGTLDVIAQHNPTLTLYNAKTGQVYQRITTDGYEVIAWSPDGSLLAVGARDTKKITIWNAYAGTRESDIEVDPIDSPMWQLKWSPDQSKIAMVPRWGPIYVWDVNTTQLLRTLPFQFEHASILWGADSQTLYALGNYGAIVSWDVDSGDKLRSVGPSK